MSIQFEIDGPYKAMMIPAAKEKQKTTELDITLHNTQFLKKRYVVFNFKNQIS
jgi:DNA polymerase elongation subunit (family B)